MSKKRRKPSPCAWTTQADALDAFAKFTGSTQGAQHIKPLHWYVASRLVVEGGFDPGDITPRPPFVVQTRRAKNKPPVLQFDPSAAGGGERTVLGGLKTKNVDVVVTREGIGPVLAVSCKGVTGAYRNLTNRLEETIGECTNLHITYPALVLGYLVVLRANRVVGATPIDGAPATVADAASTAAEGYPDDPSDSALDSEGDEDGESDVVDEAADDVAYVPPPGAPLKRNDMALTEVGAPVPSIVRFHDALQEMEGRRGIRDELSRYEAIALALVDMSPTTRGVALASYPPAESPLRLERFFGALYTQYDERFVVRAPDLASGTRRRRWASGLTLPGLDYTARIADD